RPNASTLNGYVQTVIANAAIVPAGINGSVDVYASQNTDLIIDINGYYAPQSGITLAQGTAAGPSLSFSGDAGTGIFSSGTGTVDIATAGSSRLRVLPNGDLDLTGNVNTSNGIITGDIVNAKTQYNLSGQRILSNPGTNNLFAGVNAGAANTSGC